MKKVLLGIIVVGVLATGAYLLGGVGGPTRSDAKTPTLPPVQEDPRILADAKVVPVRYAALSLPNGGQVAEVLVGEGDKVEAGQALVRLDAERQKAAVAQAEAVLRLSEAQLAQANKAPRAAELAAARAAVASALENLNHLKAGNSARDVEMARLRWEQAKDELWSAQCQRDALGGSHLSSGAAKDQSKAAVAAAEMAAEIARLQYEEAKEGPRPDQIRAAEAQLAQARATLAVLEDSPDAEAIRVAQAQVDQNAAALQQAKIALADAELKAPFAGTIASLDVKAGEQVAPGAEVARLADLSAWQIETDDVTELSIVNVGEGAKATITVDALPGLKLPGKVSRIKAFGANKQGDIVYTVTITPEQQDQRLRWNMTASVAIEPK